MRYDVVVSSRFKHVAVKVLNLSSLPSSTYRLLTCISSSEYFDMDHIMLLSPELRVVVCPTKENQISWLKIFKLDIWWQHIVLVALIPSI
jgi:hypothetical protein